MTCCVLPVQQQYGSCTTPTFLSFPSYTSQILFPLQDITDALAFQILPANCCVRVCCGLADGQYSVLFPWHVPKRCMSNKRQLGESLCWWRTCALGEALWPHDYWHPPSAVQELHQQHAPGSRRDHWITLQNQSREYMWGLDIILLLLFMNTIVYYYYFFFFHFHLECRKRSQEAQNSRYFCFMSTHFFVALQQTLAVALIIISTSHLFVRLSF